MWPAGVALGIMGAVVGGVPPGICGLKVEAIPRWTGDNLEVVVRWNGGNHRSGS